MLGHTHLMAWILQPLALFGYDSGPNMFCVGLPHSQVRAPQALQAAQAWPLQPQHHRTAMWMTSGKSHPSRLEKNHLKWASACLEQFHNHDLQFCVVTGEGLISICCMNTMIGICWCHSCLVTDVLLCLAVKTQLARRSEFCRHQG